MSSKSMQVSSSKKKILSDLKGDFFILTVTMDIALIIIISMEDVCRIVKVLRIVKTITAAMAALILLTEDINTIIITINFFIQMDTIVVFCSSDMIKKRSKILVTSFVTSSSCYTVFNVSCDNNSFVVKFYDIYFRRSRADVV